MKLPDGVFYLGLEEIQSVVFNDKAMPPQNILTWIRLFSQPEKLIARRGVGIHKNLARQVLGDEKFSQVASAGRIGRNIRIINGLFVYREGGSLLGGGFIDSESEFNHSLSLIQGIMGTIDSVSQGH